MFNPIPVCLYCGKEIGKIYNFRTNSNKVNILLGSLNVLVYLFSYDNNGALESSSNSVSLMLSSCPLPRVVVSFTFSHQSSLIVSLSFIHYCFMQGRSKKCIQTAWDFEVFRNRGCLVYSVPTFVIYACMKVHNWGRTVSQILYQTSLLPKSHAHIWVCKYSEYVFLLLSSPANLMMTLWLNSPKFFLLHI